MTATQMSTQAVPDHVPAGLVWEHSFDDFNRELDDPYLAISRLHDGPEILWARSAIFGQPAWVVTRHDLIQEVFIDTEHFSSARSNLAMLGVSWRLNPLEYDPPEHHAYRRVLNPFFTPKAVSILDETVGKTCEVLIAEFGDRGSCEFIEEFAEKFPSYIFLDLLGLPRDMLPDFLAWHRDMMRAPDPAQRLAAMKKVLDYLDVFVDEQRQGPTTELMNGIVTARMPDGRPLDKGEIMGMCYLLYIGGLDTVLSTLGWIMRHLAGDRALQERLRANPDDIPRAVEEFLRAFPVANPHRTVKKDVVFHGVPMKAGDEVLLPICLAGRDPRVYEAPHVVDIDRGARHLAFATGPHTCLGLHLARRELRAVLKAMLSHCKNIRLAEGGQYEYHVGGTFGVDRLYLEWERA